MRFLVIFLSLYSFSVLASQKARVISSKAIVYSDMDLLSPIGTLNHGKIITVGDKKRKHGSILPTIVNGRVAYVRVTDLTLERDMVGNINNKVNATEHDPSINFAKPTDKLNENNYVQFTAATFDLGTNWQQLVAEFGETPSSMFALKAIFEHRPDIHNWSWGFGLDYYFSNQNNISMQMGVAEATVYYSLIPFYGIFTADILLGGSFSAALVITTPDDQYKGSLLGMHFGGQIRLFPFSKIGFTGGIKYQTFYLEGLDTITINTDTNAILGSVGGLEIYGGLSYRF